MVYIVETMKVCHPLTEEGKSRYDELLTREADRMIVDSKHKVLAFFVKIFNMFGIANSLIQNRYDKLLDDIEADRQ